MALAHVNSDRVEAAYRRSDLFERRRGLMEQWGAFRTGPSAGCPQDRPLTLARKFVASFRARRQWGCPT